MSSYSVASSTGHRHRRVASTISSHSTVHGRNRRAPSSISSHGTIGDDSTYGSITTGSFEGTGTFSLIGNNTHDLSRRLAALGRSALAIPPITPQKTYLPSASELPTPTTSEFERTFTLCGGKHTMNLASHEPTYTDICVVSQIHEPITHEQTTNTLDLKHYRLNMPYQDTFADLDIPSISPPPKTTAVAEQRAPVPLELTTNTFDPQEHEGLITPCGNERAAVNIATEFTSNPLLIKTRAVSKQRTSPTREADRSLTPCGGPHVTFNVPSSPTFTSNPTLTRPSDRLASLGFGWYVSSEKSENTQTTKQFTTHAYEADTFDLHRVTKKEKSYTSLIESLETQNIMLIEQNKGMWIQNQQLIAQNERLDRENQDLKKRLRAIKELTSI